MEGVTLDMERFRQGDSLIFKTVFDGLYHSLCLFTNRFLNNLDASEDIVQEAFCALWNHREEMESVIHIKSFLYSVTRNISVNTVKTQKKIAYRTLKDYIYEITCLLFLLQK